jgi:CheY-like chemotaxis protein
MLLRRSGHEVLTADSGPAGLQSALSELPEVVLLDLGLPGLDGYEVARRLREQTDKPLLIAMSGYGQAEDSQTSAGLSGMDRSGYRRPFACELQREGRGTD